MDFDIAMIVLRDRNHLRSTRAPEAARLVGRSRREGWKGFIGHLGIRPPLFGASVSLVAELGGGLALIAGLLVPLAGAGLVAQSIVLFRKVHWPLGFWTANGGIEFPLAFMAGAFAVQVLGPGAWSLDAQLPVDVLYQPAVRWTLLGIAVAVALAVAFWPAPAQPQAASTEAAAE